MNLFYVILLMIITVAIGLTGLIMIVHIGCAYEMMRAHQRVEARFLALWDKTKTNELLAWMSVKNQILTDGADHNELAAVNQRIKICKEQHRTYRQMRMPGSGRVVIVSMLN